MKVEKEGGYKIYINCKKKREGQLQVVPTS